MFIAKLKKIYDNLILIRVICAPIFFVYLIIFIFTFFKIEYIANIIFKKVRSQKRINYTHSQLVEAPKLFFQRDNQISDLNVYSSDEKDYVLFEYAKQTPFYSSTQLDLIFEEKFLNKCMIKSAGNKSTSLLSQSAKSVDKEKKKNKKEQPKITQKNKKECDNKQGKKPENVVQSKTVPSSQKNNEELKKSENKSKNKNELKQSNLSSISKKELDINKKLKKEEIPAVKKHQSENKLDNGIQKKSSEIVEAQKALTQTSASEVYKRMDQNEGVSSASSTINALQSQKNVTHPFEKPVANQPSMIFDSASHEDISYTFTDDTEGLIGVANNSSDMELESENNSLQVLCSEYVALLTKAINKFPGKKHTCVAFCTYGLFDESVEVVINEKKMNCAYKSHIIACIKRTKFPKVLSGKKIKFIL